MKPYPMVSVRPNVCQSLSLTALVAGWVKMAPTKPINGIIDRNLIALGFTNCLKKMQTCAVNAQRQL